MWEMSSTLMLFQLERYHLQILESIQGFPDICVNDPRVGRLHEPCGRGGSGQLVGYDPSRWEAEKEGTKHDVNMVLGRKQKGNKYCLNMILGRKQKGKVTDMA